VTARGTLCCCCRHHTISCPAAARRARLESEGLGIFGLQASADTQLFNQDTIKACLPGLPLPLHQFTPVGSPCVAAGGSCAPVWLQGVAVAAAVAVARAVAGAGVWGRGLRLQGAAALPLSLRVTVLSSSTAATAQDAVAHNVAAPAPWEALWGSSMIKSSLPGGVVHRWLACAAPLACLCSPPAVWAVVATCPAGLAAPWLPAVLHLPHPRPATGHCHLPQRPAHAMRQPAARSTPAVVYPCRGTSC